MTETLSRFQFNKDRNIPFVAWKYFSKCKKACKWDRIWKPQNDMLQARCSIYKKFIFYRYKNPRPELNWKWHEGGEIFKMWIIYWSVGAREVKSPNQVDILIKKKVKPCFPHNSFLFSFSSFCCLISPLKQLWENDTTLLWNWKCMSSTSFMSSINLMSSCFQFQLWN